MYVPPYTISETTLAHVAEITRLLEKHRDFLRVRKSLRLRRRSLTPGSPRQRRAQAESRMLSLLRSTPAPTVAQLAKKMHVSERTVARRPASLRARGLLPPSQRTR